MAETPQQYLARIGRKGGKNRVKNQSAEERKKSAQNAAAARWAKTKKGIADLLETAEKREKTQSRKAAQRKKGTE